jgi:hypothetical protein
MYCLVQYAICNNIREWANRCRTFGKPLLQDMWGPKKGRTDIVEKVDVEVGVPTRLRLQ